MAMASPSEDEKALLELHEKLETNNQMLRMVQSQEQRITIAIRRADITVEELKELPESTAMYKPVGKAYFLEPKAQLMTEIKEATSAAQEEAARAAAQREHAERAIKATEGEIRELLMHAAPGTAAAAGRAAQAAAAAAAALGR